jgi:hypothetical protein
VADVEQPVARYRRVDGEHERPASRRECPVDELLVERLVAGEVELEPVEPVRRRVAHVLDGGGAHRREAVRQPVSRGDPRHGGFAVVMDHPRVAGGGQDDRQADAPAEQRRGRVRSADVV